MTLWHESGSVDARWSQQLEAGSLRSQIAVIPFVLNIENALSGLAVIDPSSARDLTITLFQFPH